MLLIQTRRKCHARPLKKKYEALEEVVKGISKLTVGSKYDIPNNTLSTWIESKDKITQSYRE